MKQLLIFGTLVLTLVACKTGKNAATAEATEAPPPPPPVPVTQDIPEAHQDDVTLTRQWPDSLFFRIQRTSCYGQCPVYTLSIYNDGYAEYEGKRNVEHEGVFYTRFTQPELDQIVAEANKCGYFTLQPVYDRGATDFPSTYTYLNNGASKHAIKNRQGAPRELKDFEKFVDALLAQKELTEKR